MVGIASNWSLCVCVIIWRMAGRLRRNSRASCTSVRIFSQKTRTIVTWQRKWSVWWTDSDIWTTCGNRRSWRTPTLKTHAHCSSCARLTRSTRPASVTRPFLSSATLAWVVTSLWRHVTRSCLLLFLFSCVELDRKWQATRRLRKHSRRAREDGGRIRSPHHQHD